MSTRNFLIIFAEHLARLLGIDHYGFSTHPHFHPLFFFFVNYPFNSSMVFPISVFCPSQDMFWRFCNAEWADKQIAPDTVHVLAKEAARKYVAQNIE